MLVLARQRRERIVIEMPGGQLCKVEVTDIRGDKVRIGIEAPKECAVHREEVWNAIQRERESNDNPATI